MKGDNTMSEKVERVESGSSNDFSAIKGKGNAARGPEGKSYGEKPAIAKIKTGDNKGE